MWEKLEENVKKVGRKFSENWNKFQSKTGNIKSHPVTSRLVRLLSHDDSHSNNSELLYKHMWAFTRWFVQHDSLFRIAIPMLSNRAPLESRFVFVARWLMQHQNKWMYSHMQFSNDTAFSYTTERHNEIEIFSFAHFRKNWIFLLWNTRCTSFVYIHLKRSHFWDFSFGDTAIFPNLGRKYRFAIFNVSDIGKPPLSNAATCSSIRHSVSVLWREMWTHLITRTTLFIFEAESCKNFKAIFLKTLLFKSLTSNVYFPKNFALKRLGEVSIDPKFYLVLRSVHNSIPQKWDLFRWMYTFYFVLKEIFSSEIYAGFTLASDSLRIVCEWAKREYHSYFIY